MFDKLIHKTLRIPYKLTVTQDTGSGRPIVFLHGIASSSATWRNVIPLLDTHVFRIITVDLLGFGDSPKPDWANYTVDDHATSVLATIKKLGLRNYILVGHSMGSLIAARVAAKDSNAISHLVLCSMPLYQTGDLDESINAYKKTGRHLSNLYFKIYQSLAERPDFTLKRAREVVTIAGNDTSFHLDETTWVPFTKSLKNTIEQQTAFYDLQTIAVPTDVIYGSMDIFVLGNYFKVFAKTNKNITVTQVTARHEITPKYAREIAIIISKT